MELKRAQTNMKKKILIADDDPAVRQMYKDRLELENFDVLFADNGVEALKVIRQEKPILVLLDIMMPEKTGMEVLEEVKKDLSISNITIGMLTVLDNDDIKEKAFDLGAKYYLVKSQIMPKEVVEIIKKEISEL
jgi:DNA-binding response OmpR family regulator